MKIFILIALAAALFCGCGKKKHDTKVDFDQINVDESTNYKFLFRDMILEEKRKSGKHKKEEF